MLHLIIVLRLATANPLPVDCTLGDVRLTNGSSHLEGRGPIPVSTHTGDNLPPLLIDVSLDLNLGLLMLTFNEVVNDTSFDVTRVRLIDSGITV